MALEIGGEPEHVGVQLEQVVGGHQPRDDRRSARAEPAGSGMSRRDPEFEPVGGMQSLERPHDEVAAVAGTSSPVYDRERAGLDDLELQMQ